LKVEHVFEDTIEMVGPQMAARRGVDELAGDSNTVGRLADAAFEYVADTELAADLLDVDRLALVGEARIAGDHEQRLEARESGDDVLVAFKIGDDVAALKQAKAELDAAGIASAAADHDISKSLYFADPDGNRIELYDNQSDVWKRDPSAVASYKPLTL
jgi:catechol 2,3-dioxygenase-like lactoylglutathione lyase family enzyme